MLFGAMEVAGIVFGEKFVHLMPDKKAMYFCVAIILFVSTVIKIPGIVD